MNSMAAGVPALVISLLHFGKPMKSLPTISNISSVWIFIKPDWNSESSISFICIKLPLTLQMQLNLLVYGKGRVPPTHTHLMQFTNDVSVLQSFAF